MLATAYEDGAKGCDGKAVLREPVYTNEEAFSVLVPSLPPPPERQTSLLIVYYYYINIVIIEHGTFFFFSFFLILRRFFLIDHAPLHPIDGGHLLIYTCMYILACAVY